MYQQIFQALKIPGRKKSRASVEVREIHVHRQYSQIAQGLVSKLWGGAWFVLPLASYVCV